MKSKYVFELTYEITQNSNLNEVEAHKLACSLKGFMERVIEEEIADAFEVLRHDVDTLTETLQGLVNKRG